VQIKSVISWGRSKDYRLESKYCRAIRYVKLGAGRERYMRVSIFSGIALILLACFKASASGAGETGSVRDVRGFDSVSFGTSGELIITQGDREALEITARANDLPNIVTEVRGGTLYIGKEGTGFPFSFSPPVFRLTMKAIAGLETHSSGKITANNLRASSLRIQISSSGGISIDSLAADSLDVQISSSGSFSVAGRVEQQTIRLSSSGSYLARNLESRTARVNVSSSGSTTLRVADSLEANVTSSGNVRYYGNPPRVNGNVTSSGRLVRLGD
jgi:hypothetical protein